MSPPPSRLQPIHLVLTPRCSARLRRMSTDHRGSFIAIVSLLPPLISSHLHCFPVRLCCGGYSFQFGRTSTRLPSHLSQIGAQRGSRVISSPQHMRLARLGRGLSEQQVSKSQETPWPQLKWRWGHILLSITQRPTNHRRAGGPHAPYYRAEQWTCPDAKDARQ
jgi:hypothetical protein